MGKREKVEALILKRRDVREADRLLVVLTRERGLLKVVAKGVRRIPSRRGGHLEPFRRVVSIVTGTEERLYLAAAEALEDYRALREDAAALSQVQLMAQLIMNLFEEREPLPEVFDALCQACEMLPALPPLKRQALEAAFMLLALEKGGVLPALEACRECGERRPDEAVVLFAEINGWRCLSCHRTLAGTHASLSPRLLKAVKWLAQYPRRALQLKLEAEESAQIILSLRSYVASALEWKMPQAQAFMPQANYGV